LAVISSSESKIQGTKIIKILLEHGGNLDYVEYLEGLLVKVSFLKNESAAIFCCINKFGIATSKWEKSKYYRQNRFVHYAGQKKRQ
jgi:predicted ATP-grasp superfamily ATP-dependent carboligase